MKSLHKKLSAMLLAGVVVIGGVVGSGVSSFAASAKVAKAKVVQSDYQDRQNIKVKNIVKRAGGQVLKSSKNGREIDKLVKQDYSGKKYLKSGGDVRNICSIPLNFNQFKHKGIKLVKIKCQDFYYLIQLN